MPNPSQRLGLLLHIWAETYVSLCLPTNQYSEIQKQDGDQDMWDRKLNGFESLEVIASLYRYS